MDLSHMKMAAMFWDVTVCLVLTVHVMGLISPSAQKAGGIYRPEGRNRSVSKMTPSQLAAIRQKTHDYVQARRILFAGRASSTYYPFLDTSDCSNRYDPDAITGGTDVTDISDMPWVVYLLNSGNVGKVAKACTGALIAPRWILTVAQCIEGSDEHPPVIDKHSFVSSTVGRVDLNVYNKGELMRGTQFSWKDDIFIHPMYYERSLFADIALIKLPKPARPGKTSELLKPVCLPLNPIYVANKRCVLAGWGAASAVNVTSPKLRKVRVSIPQQWISQRLQTSYKSPRVTGACRGDLGAPVMCNIRGVSTLTGLMSKIDRNCDARHEGNKFTNVRQFLPWIKRIITRNS